MPRRMALSNTDAKLLIREVEKRTCLWDHEDDRYNDRYHMARAWTEIAEVIHMPEDRLRVKWKNMRDLFRKELKKYGSSADYMGKWRHFNSLAFLNKSAVAGNGSENNEESCEEVTPVTKQEYIALDADTETENGVEVYYDDTFEDPLPEKRAKLSSDDDYDLMFLKSLAPYFRQLEPIRKLVVRSKMQDMLLNEIAAQASSTQTQFKKS